MPMSRRFPEHAMLAGTFSMNQNDIPRLLAVDGITATLLIRLAEMWGVSEEDAVRRVIEQATAPKNLPNKEGRLEHSRNCSAVLV